MPNAKPTPDRATVYAHMRHLTRRWPELGQAVVLEIVHLSADDVAQVKHVARFAADEMGLDMAVDHIVGMNSHGINSYAVVNPVDATRPLAQRSRAKAEDIVASFYHFADADTAEAAENIRNFVGPKCTFHVLTGTQPVLRPHAYWELEEPTRNMPAWRRIQSSIAATLKTDPAVIDPPRIMRIAGTINWPKPKKLAKGYVAELTHLKIYDSEDRAPVTSERMERAFSGPHSAATAGPAIDTGDSFAPALDRERTRIQALSGADWHNAVIRLVASYVSRGLGDDEIHSLTAPLTLAGYTADDTRAEVQTGIEGARRKGWTPDAPRAAFEPYITPEDEAAPTWPTLLTDFDEMNLPRREWVYGTDYIRKYVSVVASAGGIGKTSQAIAEGLAIVTGRPLLGVEVRESCNVWIINLEDPEEELRMRALAARKHYQIPKEKIEGRLFLDGEDTIQITLAVEGRDGLMKNEPLLEAMRLKIIENNIGVVIIDPFVSTHMVNENSNASIQAVVAMLRSLARNTRASISLVHHTRKGNGEDAGIDSVRGAGSLIGAARAVRVVNRISEADAERLGIPPKDAKGIFRVDDGKANLAPPAEAAVYRQMIGVQLDNGEWVGVAVPFVLPDEWAGMTDAVVNDMLRQIAAGPARETDGEEYYSVRPQDKTRWVGAVITEYPFQKAEDFKSEAQAKMILRKWLKTGLLEEVEYYSETQRKDRKGVTAVGRVGDQT